MDFAEKVNKAVEYALDDVCKTLNLSEEQTKSVKMLWYVQYIKKFKELGEK